MRAGLYCLGLAFCLVLSIATPWVSDADACKTASPERHTIDVTRQGTDKAPPTQPKVIAWSLSRGARNGTSCDGLAGFDLEVRSTDDVSPADKIGYEVVAIEGIIPGAIPLSFVGRLDKGHVWFDWYEDERHILPFWGSIEVVAIDEAGRRSPPSSPVRIELFESGNSKTAVPTTDAASACARGDASWCLTYGRRLLHGAGLKIDRAKARDVFLRACTLGNARSCELAADAKTLAEVVGTPRSDVAPLRVRALELRLDACATRGDECSDLAHDLGQGVRVPACLSTPSANCGYGLFAPGILPWATCDQSAAKGCWVALGLPREKRPGWWCTRDTMADLKAPSAAAICNARGDAYSDANSRPLAIRAYRYACKHGLKTACLKAKGGDNASLCASGDGHACLTRAREVPAERIARSWDACRLDRAEGCARFALACQAKPDDPGCQPTQPLRKGRQSAIEYLCSIELEAACRVLKNGFEPR